MPVHMQAGCHCWYLALVVCSPDQPRALPQCSLSLGLGRGRILPGGVGLLPRAGSASGFSGPDSCTGVSCVQVMGTFIPCWTWETGRLLCVETVLRSWLACSMLNWAAGSAFLELIYGARAGGVHCFPLTLMSVLEFVLNAGCPNSGPS